MSKRDSYLQGLERRRQQHVAVSRSHVTKPAEPMDDDQLERERKRLEFERTKLEVEVWQARKDATLAGGGEFGLSSNQVRYGGTPRRDLNALKRHKRPGWR